MSNSLVSCLLSILILTAGCSDDTQQDKADAGGKVDTGGKKDGQISSDGAKMTWCKPHKSGKKYPNDGPFLDLYEWYTTLSKDGAFRYQQLLGTGHYICDKAVGKNKETEYRWLPIRGTDIGNIADDGQMGLVLSSDDFKSDGHIYMDHKEKKHVRTFRREDDIPCQPTGISFMNKVVTFGEPAITPKGLFVMIPYEPAKGSSAKPLGSRGLYFHHRAKEELYLIVDDRPVTKDPTPASYKASGVSYTCKESYPVPTKGCAAGGKLAPCSWKKIERFIGANIHDESVFRALYSVKGGAQHTALFKVSLKEDKGKVTFPLELLLDTYEKVQVPGQTTGTIFKAINSSWVNDKGVVIFLGIFDDKQTQASKGIYSLYKGTIVEVASNSPSSTIKFVGFDEDQTTEDLKKHATKVNDPDALSSTASLGHMLNNAGPEKLGVVFFTAAFQAGAKQVRKGVFMATPTASGGKPASYKVTELVRSGTDQVSGGKLGFFMGSFHSLSANDKNQLVFKTIGANKVKSTVLFYDGRTPPGKLYPMDLTSKHLPKGCVSEPFWTLISNYSLNEDGDFMFRVACLQQASPKAPWSVYRAKFLK